MDSNKVLEFIKGEENHAKVSLVGRSSSTLFDCYSQAFHAIRTIIRENNAFQAAYSSDVTKRNTNLTTNLLYSFSNNIIVFSAPRGGGKTSAMLTFSKALEDLERNVVKEDKSLPNKQLLKQVDELKRYNYIVLPPIDPTSIDDRHDILTTILARIIKYASEAWENWMPNSFHQKEDDRITQKNKLLNQIRKSYRGVNSLRHPLEKQDEWTLENLSQLGDCASLKENFMETVQLFLELVKSKSTDGYMVIQIDDVDMNNKRVFSILEQLHDYLLIPNVIIIMATDLDAISNIIYNKFFEDMNLKDNGRNAQSLASDLAEQYMMKLFPPLRRVYLPNINENLQITGDNLEICYRRAKSEKLTEEEEELDQTNPNTGANMLRFLRRDRDNDNDKNKNKDKDKDSMPLERTLLDFIYLRTGLVFTQHSDYHYILPTNQRGIAQLLSVLMDMEAVPRLADRCRPKQKNTLVPLIKKPENQRFLYNCYKDETASEYLDELKAWERNILKFRDYFLGAWVSRRLDYQDARMIHELDSIRMSGKNRYVIRELHKRENYHDGCVDKTCPECEDGTHLYSYAYMIRELDKYERREPDSLLPFAIHTYYSLLSHRSVLHNLVNFYKPNPMTLVAPNELDDVCVKMGSTCFCDFDILRKLYGGQLLEVENKMMVEYPNEQLTVFREWRAQAFDQAKISKGDTEKVAAVCAALFQNLDKPETNSITAPLLNIVYANRTFMRACVLGGQTLSEDLTKEQTFTEELLMLQDTCLRVMLNWDLQHCLNSELKRGYLVRHKTSEKDDSLGFFKEKIVASYYKWFQDSLRYTASKRDMEEAEDGAGQQSQLEGIPGKTDDAHDEYHFYQWLEIAANEGTISDGAGVGAGKPGEGSSGRQPTGATSGETPSDEESRFGFQTIIKDIFTKNLQSISECYLEALLLKGVAERKLNNGKALDKNKLNIAINTLEGLRLIDFKDEMDMDAYDNLLRDAFNMVYKEFDLLLQKKEFTAAETLLLMQEIATSAQSLRGEMTPGGSGVASGKATHRENIDKLISYLKGIVASTSEKDPPSAVEDRSATASTGSRRVVKP